jgi:enoyl-CoA hydratase
MTDEVSIGRDGGSGRIRLNRPKALNALTLGMCRDITEALLAWDQDPTIHAVVIDHNEGRGFCAGGDLRLLIDSLRDGLEHARDFFRTEYRLNHLLFSLRTPSVCFMDGIVMGGGAGIAMPCRYRIATEATVFAMPETGIGIFPDVGGGWFLSRLPDRIGQWLALTGARLDGADCLAGGLATHYLPRGSLAEVKARIGREPDAVETVLRDASVAPPPARIDGLRADIARLFVSDRLESVVTALQADGSAWAAEQAAEIAKKAPRSCKVAVHQLREGRALARFADNMRMEYRLALRLVAAPDFAEGVRAFVIDKDNHPRWTPARIEDVSDEDIDALFVPWPAEEEWTPL